MGSGLPGFPQDFSCPAVLGNSTREPAFFRLLDFHRLWLAFPNHSTRVLVCNSPTGLHSNQVEPHNPESTTHADFDVQLGFGCFPFARHYLGNRGFFLFLGVLRCLTSPRWPHAGYEFTRVTTQHYPRRVSPFGDLRIKACLQLTGAYRSLPRPSSPSDAKASTIRS